MMDKRDWEWNYPFIPFEYSELFWRFYEEGYSQDDIIKILEKSYGMPVWEDVLKQREIDKQRRYVIESMWEL